MCGIDGCSYKTGHTGNMTQHKTRKHAIGEYVTKMPNDGKERDKAGKLISACGIT